MSRLPALVLAALAAATVGAFFIVQHLKVTTPLIAGPSAPRPAVINPLAGGTCGGVSHRSSTISFYLLHRADDVGVYVIDSGGAVVATLASGRHMPIKVRIPDGVFTWHGREDNGTIAPDGVYEIRVALIHQGRTIVLSPADGGAPFTIKVETHPPRPVVTAVTPAVIPHGPSSRATIRYRGTEGHSAQIELYRTDLPGPPRPVKTFRTLPHSAMAVWDGLIDGRPAPPGVYLTGLQVTDAACSTGRFPRSLPPAPGSTPGAGISVRYLTAAPPLKPVAPGATARVRVDSAAGAYRWSLAAAGTSKPVARGDSSSGELSVALPGRAPALYVLSLRAGPRTAQVPLVGGGARGTAPVLVVLPALTWQGTNPVDDTGDGQPDTLAAGRSVDLTRPLVGGLPPGLPAEAALLAYLARTHRRFDLTTDLALATAPGPALGRYRGVLLAGSERWVPPALGAALRAYVRAGGHVLSLGTDSLRAQARVSAQRASAPTPLRATDVFGVRHGSGAGAAGALDVLEDGLGVFANVPGVLADLPGWQPITAVTAPAQLLSAAGTSLTSLAVAGIRLGEGTVVELSMTGLGTRLNAGASVRALFDGAWTQLAGGA